MVINRIAATFASFFCLFYEFVKLLPKLVFQHRLKFAGKPILLLIFVDVLDGFKEIFALNF